MILAADVKALGYKECLGLPRTPFLAYISRAKAICAVGLGLRRCDAFVSTVVGFCRSEYCAKTTAYAPAATVRRKNTYPHIHARVRAHAQVFVCRSVAASYLLSILLKRKEKYCDAACDAMALICLKASQLPVNPLKNNKKGGFYVQA